jgi:hypothetical protein
MVLAFFQWVRLSYSGRLGFGVKLQETLQRADVNDSMKVALKDLQFLCEFAIPTVDQKLNLHFININKNKLFY